ncbi:hypothetical protein ADUPG1_007712, partial [Aduncisulcus paluster]
WMDGEKFPLLPTQNLHEWVKLLGERREWMVKKVVEAQKKVAEGRLERSEEGEWPALHSYVLVRPKKKPPKLHPRWAGPVEVVKLFKDRNSLEVKWLSGKEENEVISLRRIVKFRSQDYSLEDLKKLAQLDDEAYVVEEIRGHRMGDDGLELLIKWLGYEEVFWEPKDGLKTVPLVMEYCQEKELE